MRPLCFFCYVFSRSTNQPMLSALGAHHGCELPYVFDVLPKPTDVEKKIVNVVQGYWLDFAARGDPNGNSLPHWPKYTLDTERLIEIGDNVEVREHYRQKELDALDKQLYEWKPAPAVTPKAGPAGSR
jgi:para-nitrobenzyl esterase